MHPLLGERCPRPEFGIASAISATDQLSPGAEANHIRLADDDAVSRHNLKSLPKEKYNVRHHKESSIHGLGISVNQFGTLVNQKSGSAGSF